eukprot:m.15997 g.15997  ORF g.15997 m.15997 type:complete len:154 (-) comp10826_c0_seq2:318-779(-)
MSSVDIDTIISNLRHHQTPIARLETVTQLQKYLTEGPESEVLEHARRFMERGGAVALHDRLHAMDGDWMGEARLGVTEILDTLSRLPCLQVAISPLDGELAAAVTQAHANKHHGHGHGANDECDSHSDGGHGGHGLEGSQHNHNHAKSKTVVL